MTYPIIRWNGGGGGMVGNDLAVRLGDGPFISMLVNLPSNVAAADISSRIRAAADAAGVDPATTPADADVARCRCVIDRVEGLAPEVLASAMEACMSDPNGLLTGLEAQGVDVSGCAGAASSDAPVWQNPWVIGGAAAVVLGGLAFFALK